MRTMLIFAGVGLAVFGILFAAFWATTKLVFYFVSGGMALVIDLWFGASLFILACVLVLVLELYHRTRGKKLR